MVQSAQREADGANRTIVTVGRVVGIAVFAFAVDEPLSDRHLQVRDDLSIFNEFLAFDGDVLGLLQEVIRSSLRFKFAHRHLQVRRSRLRATVIIL
jgi:hypothetical protein